jgi:methylated-DNA-[protein]-cysteine S-methyltransferase
MTYRYAVIPTKPGWVGIIGSEAGLKYIILPQVSAEVVFSALDKLLNGVIPDNSFFNDLTARLRHYFSGEPVNFTDKADLTSATPFQHKVWQAARSIPYGETKSYSWVAQQIGMPKAARAVGQALARNPLPLVVPCHRVVATSGELRGFAYGLDMKQYLLGIERSSD